MSIVRNKAVKFLLDNGVAFLPIEVEKLIKSQKNWELIPYSMINNITLSSEIRKIQKNCLAFTIPSNDGFLILYDEKLSYEEKQKILAHEISHIVLEHSTNNKVLGELINRKIQNNQEREADEFSKFLLTPSGNFFKKRTT